MELDYMQFKNIKKSYITYSDGEMTEQFLYMY